MKGIFTLNDPRDLLTKLEHDYEALKKDRNNSYSAFNFFVTAEHMLDWIHPGRSKSTQRSSEKNQSTILQICSHIANGAKHFEVEDKRHKSVSSTHRGGGTGFGGANLGTNLINANGNLPRGSSLFVKLNGDAEKQYGRTVNVLLLAEDTLNFWKAHSYFKCMDNDS